MSNDKLPPGDSHGRLIRSTSILSLGTLSSRILGFIRDIILAGMLGTGLRADAFFVALKIPNLLRSFVGEGASDSAVVPVFAEYRVKKTPEEFWRFVSVFLVLALMVLSALTLAGILLAPWIIRVIAPGFMADPEKLTLTVRLTRLMFPYIILIGLTAYSVAILYTFRSFVSPAFSPCLFNIAIIAGALFSPRVMDEPVYGLALSVLAGGFLQLMVHIKPMRKQGLRWHRPATLRHPGALQIGRLLAPRLVGAGVYQLTVLIDTFCASLASIVGAGGISAIYYANRIIQFPLGLFSIAMASAALPTLSGFAATEDMEQFKRTLMFSLKNILYVLFPVAVATMLLARPIIRVLFERGAFDAYSTTISSSALVFYAVGLFSFGAIKILVSAFYALKDTKTPVKVAGLCLGVNALLNFVLMFPMKIGGIALASSLAAMIDVSILFYLLQKRLGDLSRGLRGFGLKIFISSGVMALVMATLRIYIPSSSGIIELIVLGAGGVLVYGAMTWILNVEQARQIWQWISHRR